MLRQVALLSLTLTFATATVCTAAQSLAVHQRGASTAAPRIPGAYPDGGLRHRLYVSTLVGSEIGTTYAYDIVNGLAKRPPVLKYGGGAGGNDVSGPLAPGPYDELLSGNDLGYDENYGSFGLSGFAKDSTTQTRSFYPPRINYCEYLTVTALASLPRSAMFVGYACYFSGAQPDGRKRAWGEGVIVYKVGSPTTQRLARILHLGFDGLATDADGNLYVSTFHGIAVVATPLEHPRITRIIRGTSFTGNRQYPGQIWIDSHGELYVFNYPAMTISAYPDGARGTVSPDRTISTSVGVLKGSIAVYGNTLFADVTNGSDQGVEALDARVDGEQKPRQYLEALNIFAGITVGL